MKVCLKIEKSEHFEKQKHILKNFFLENFKRSDKQTHTIMQRQARPEFSLRLYLALALIATVASVPTSVLVQNSELANANANNNQKNRQNSQKIFNALGGGGSSSINKGKLV